MVKYYAVKIGVEPGIYETWTECKKNIDKFPSAKFKKFSSKSEATKFINENNQSVDISEKSTKSIKSTKSTKSTKSIKSTNSAQVTKDQIVKDDYNFESCINVFTDGSCYNNGSKNAIAGCGIYFANNDPRNKSFRLREKENYPVTNNRAELKAILYAISVLDSEIKNNETVVIHTDSQYSILSFTSNKINTKTQITIPNYDYVSKGNSICKKYSNIKFHYVRAHTGKQDFCSIGNDNADKLANDSISDNIKQNSQNIILRFGKYKNKTLGEIYQLDKNYLSWCVANIKIQQQEIKLFLESKLVEINKLDKNDSVQNTQSIIVTEPKTKPKIKIYKINGIRCIKDNGNYYSYVNKIKGKVIAITNEYNEIELVEE
jgi:ribonuclease HI